MENLLGKIFVCEWGYDQTNVDFYTVTKATKKSVYIQRVGSKRIRAESFDTYNTVPDLEVLKGRVMRKAVKIWNDDATIKIESYAHARLWNGKPQLETQYA
jgi:hypothetical protein